MSLPVGSPVLTVMSGSDIDLLGVGNCLQKLPEKPAAEMLAGHQGPHSESRGQPPSEVCDQTAQ